MKLYDELKARGLIAQVTNEEEISETDQQRQGDVLHRLRSDRRQPACRSLHGALPDEAHADGGQQADRAHRRRHRHDRRPVRPYRYAFDDDRRDHPAQLRLLQEADGALYRVRRGQGADGEQCGLADESQLHRVASATSVPASRSTICSAQSASSSAWKRA